MNLLFLAAAAGLVTGAVTAVRGRALAFVPMLDRAVWCVLIASSATEILLTFPWWPELNTVRLVLPGIFGLGAAALSRIAAGGHRNVVLALGSVVLSVAGAVVFAFATSDLLGVYDWGAGLVAYTLATGLPTAGITWLGCRFLPAKAGDSV